MAHLATASANAQLDEVLEELCVLLQLTPSQYADAERKYDAVARCLAEPGSPLSSYDPRIYPQGSMLLRTTVRPRTQDEYDLDLVCLIDVDCERCEPTTLYNMVAEQLESRAAYARILTRMERCLRLNYAGQFHLDILPASPDVLRPPTGIKLPDRKLEKWKDNDPKRFASWFEHRTALLKSARMAANVEPLPEQEPVHGILPLRRTVQLFKRHRDVAYEGEEQTPASIVLTTLASNHYHGERLCTDALENILCGIVREIENTDGILIVLNPVNSDENFTERWNRAFYNRFVEFIYSFKYRFGELQTRRGLPAILTGINDLFGKDVGMRAIDAYTDRHFNAARETKSLRFDKSRVALTTAPAVSYVVPRTTFYGD